MRSGMWQVVSHLFTLVGLIGPLLSAISVLAAAEGLVRYEGTRTCPGDCNSDGRVTIDELVRGVRIALGDLGAEDCGALDTKGGATVTIDELIEAVGAALFGCDRSADPTPTVPMDVSPLPTATMAGGGSATPTEAVTLTASPSASMSATGTASGTATPSSGVANPTSTSPPGSPTQAPTTSNPPAPTETDPPPATATPTPDPTGTSSPAPTAPNEPTATPAPSGASGTPTATAAVTSTAEGTPPPTSTSTATATVTAPPPTSSATLTSSATPPAAPTATATGTPAATITAPASSTPAATASRTPSGTPTPTVRPTQRGPRISFFAPVGANGCSFCCSSVCAGTPTPTPLFDGQGRRVYLRPEGRFLLVVEGRPGPSGRQPGAFLQTGSGQSPDLQMLASNNLGNGSLAVCDVQNGGVPGFDPPDLDRAGVTNAMRDVACRFTVQTSSADACTRNTFGNYSFLGGATTRQYCFQVPQVARFPSGKDTVVAARLRDDAGNLGDPVEIVIRVAP